MFVVASSPGLLRVGGGGRGKEGLCNSIIVNGFNFCVSSSTTNSILSIIMLFVSHIVAKLAHFVVWFVT